MLLPSPQLMAVDKTRFGHLQRNNEAEVDGLAMVILDRWIVTYASGIYVFITCAHKRVHVVYEACAKVDGECCCIPKVRNTMFHSASVSSCLETA